MADSTAPNEVKWELANKRLDADGKIAFETKEEADQYAQDYGLPAEDTFKAGNVWCVPNAAGNK